MKWVVVWVAVFLGSVVVFVAIPLHAGSLLGGKPELPRRLRRRQCAARRGPEKRPIEYAAGGATVLATRRTDDDRVCHEVLIETAMESRPTDQRVRTYCRGNTGWSAVATHPGEGARLP